MRKSKTYSQNFLRDKSLVSRLIEQSSISKDDYVYEIGAGLGMITSALAQRAGKVISFEIDKNLFSKLSQQFQNSSNVLVRNVDFLEQQLPDKPYKVFSNIPFSLTASIIKKLVYSPHPPRDCYLIVQKEAAKKYIGKPLDFKNSQISILLKPWFDCSVVYTFKRHDFMPQPNVDTVLFRITKKDTPLVGKKDKALYEDFVVYVFNQFKPNVIDGLSAIFDKFTMRNYAREYNFSPKAKPSELDFEVWLKLFEKLKDDRVKHSVVKGAFAKTKMQEKQIKKIHRTRVDKNWKDYK